MILLFDVAELVLMRLNSPLGHLLIQVRFIIFLALIATFLDDAVGARLQDAPLCVSDDAIGRANFLRKPSMVRRYALLDHDLTSLGCLHGNVLLRNHVKASVYIGHVVHVLSGSAEETLAVNMS